MSKYIRAVCFNDHQMVVGEREFFIDSLSANDSGLKACLEYIKWQLLDGRSVDASYIYGEAPLSADDPDVVDTFSL